MTRYFPALLVLGFLLVLGRISAWAAANYVYGEYTDMAYANTFVQPGSTTIPYAPAPGSGVTPNTFGIDWSESGTTYAGDSNGDFVTDFYFEPTAPNNASGATTYNTYASLTVGVWTSNLITLWSGSDTNSPANYTGETTGFGTAASDQTVAPITLTGSSNQISLTSSTALTVHNDLIVADSGGTENWSLGKLLTTYGTVKTNGANQVLTINGNVATRVAWDLQGTTNDNKLSITLAGVQIKVENTQTFGQLALTANSTINLTGLTTSAPKVITWNSGYAPGAFQTLYTGWQGQIGAKPAGGGPGTGGLNTQMYFALGQGVVPTTAMNQLVTSVVFDLSTNTNGATTTSSTPVAIPNFAGDPGIVNSSYDYGEWITGPTGYAELVPYFGPVPEPTTVLAGLALLAAVAWRERRRLSDLYARFSPAPSGLPWA